MDGATGPLADDKGGGEAIFSSSIRPSLLAAQDARVAGGECCG